MKHIYASLAILGIATALGGVTPPVQALPTQTLIVQGNAQELFTQGLEKYKAGDYQGAIATFTQAIRLNPKVAEVYVARGNAYYDQGDKQTALKDYNQAIGVNPNYAAAYVERGNARDDLGDRKAAIEDYNQAIRLNPNLAEAYDNRAITYIRLSKKEEAIADLQKAAQLYQQQGKSDKYQAALERIKKLQQ
jgi:tetratricopeptide (TPR) repeat protein